MTEQFLVQYVGFTSGALAREYLFVVRRPSGERREYIVTIGNEAFVSHRVRYQDAPDICSLRLHRELISNGDSSPTIPLCVTDSELVDYRNDHSPKPVKGFQPPKIEG